MNIYYDQETLDIVNYADAENNCFFDRTSRPETADVFITIPLEDNSRNISLVRNGDTIDIIKHVVQSTLWMYYDKDKTKIISVYDTGIIDHSNAYPHDTVENVGHIQLPLNTKLDFIDIQVDEHGNVTTFTNKNREKYHWLVSDWETIRDKRNKYLLLCDWTHTTDVELTDEKKYEWTVYRKSLRDITTSFENPSDVAWPIPPQ